MANFFNWVEVNLLLPILNRKTVNQDVTLPRQYRTVSIDSKQNKQRHTE